MTEDVYVRYPKGWNGPQSPVNLARVEVKVAAHQAGGGSPCCGSADATKLGIWEFPELSVTENKEELL
ncbi:BZ3501_MvSof-1269-A2-R1_Chr11g02885 [Microbotryum saponariae]|nr:BZ3501_MvSof-1269-A2-R1_Chr11g02885 [Microbotryum saponariae]